MIGYHLSPQKGFSHPHISLQNLTATEMDRQEKSSTKQSRLKYLRKMEDIDPQKSYYEYMIKQRSNII